MGYYRAGGPEMMPSHTTIPPEAGYEPESGHTTPPHDRRKPRMNAINPRAARRAIRRLTSFERIARRIMTFTTGHHVGHGKFKRARRRSR